MHLPPFISGLLGRAGAACEQLVWRTFPDRSEERKAMGNRLTNRVHRLEAAREPKRQVVFYVGCDVPEEERERFLQHKLGSEHHRYQVVWVLSFGEPNLQPGSSPGDLGEVINRRDGCTTDRSSSYAASIAAPVGFEKMASDAANAKALELAWLDWAVGFSWPPPKFKPPSGSAGKSTQCVWPSGANSSIVA